MSSSTAAASAPASPYGTNCAPGTSGSNGVRLPSWPVIDSAPIVRPWKPPSAATTVPRPVRRASLNAASFASVPELAKNTRPPRVPAGSSSASSRSARRTVGSFMTRLLVCPEHVDLGADRRRPLRGGRGPSEFTAIPATRSRYSRGVVPDPRFAATHQGERRRP